MNHGKWLNREGLTAAPVLPRWPHRIIPRQPHRIIPADRRLQQDRERPDAAGGRLDSFGLVLEVSVADREESLSYIVRKKMSGAEPSTG